MVEADQEFRPLPLYGDVLESVLSHVPTLDLLPSRRVSRTWRNSVVSSLRSSPRLKPWLLLRFPRASVAYDPHSRSWVPLRHVSDRTQKSQNQQVDVKKAGSQYRVVSHLYSQPVRSSQPQLHFILSSPSHLSIHRPLLSAAWTNLPSPRVWRVDPVVAVVGTTVVVAGGTWDFEDAPCSAVESLDLLLGSDDRQWVPRDPVPSDLDSSATWLSVAASDDAMHVLSKNNGLFSSFDPETGRWSPVCDLRPDPGIKLSAIGFTGDRLVFVGLDHDGGAMSLRLWEVDVTESGEAVRCGKEIGAMPKEMVARLVGDGFGRMTTIGFSAVGDFAYVYNPANFKEGFFYEFAERRWESVGRPKELDDDPTARIVFGCSTPTLNQLSKLLIS